MLVLSPAHLRKFSEEGYLVVEDVLNPVRDIDPVMTELSEVLDSLAKSLFATGNTSSIYPDLPFDDRYIQICVESGKNYPNHFDISLPQSDIRPDTPIHVGPAVFRFLTNPRLLDLVEDIIGAEIYSNPVQHVRMQLPKRAVAEGPHNSLVSQAPWHQDNGAVLPEADESHMLTVWTPLTEATLENSCLQVIPRTHLGDLVTHCPTKKDDAIPERFIPPDRAISLPMHPGSVLLMHKRTIHASTQNVSDHEVRISFDIRYQPVGESTGRPQFPGFVARSAAHPETVLKVPTEWAQSWYAARARLSGQGDSVFHRWRADSPACA